MSNFKLKETKETLYFFNLNEEIWIAEVTEAATVSPSIKINDSGNRSLLKAAVLAGTLTLGVPNISNANNKQIKFIDNSDDSIENSLTGLEIALDKIKTDYNTLSEKPKTTSNKVITEILSFKCLQNNWDGYGAIPVEVNSASNAISVITQLSNASFNKLEDVYPNTNGTISFYWTNNYDDAIELGIGNNTMSYYVKMSGLETKYLDQVEINKKSIKELSSFVESL